MYITDVCDMQCDYCIKVAVCMTISGQLLACDFDIIDYGIINSLRQSDLYL